MKSYLKLLLLLLSVLLLTVRCEEEGEGELSDEQDGELEDNEPGEGDEEYPEEGDESWHPEKKDPLSSEQMHALHKKIDAKGNGKVSLAEVTEFAHKMRRAFSKKQLHNDMEEMDTNTDGKVSLEEFLVYFQRGTDDEHQNEGPSKEEQEQFVEDQRQEFKAADKNNDGYVDADELTHMHHHFINDKVETETTKVTMEGQDQDGNGELTMQEFHMSGDGASEDDQEVFSKLDKDGSGTLNHEEFKPWITTGFDSDETAQKLFATADVDKDGSLTAEEMADAREQIANEDHQVHLFLHEWHEGHGKHDEL